MRRADIAARNRLREATRDARLADTRRRCARRTLQHSLGFVNALTQRLFSAGQVVIAVTSLVPLGSGALRDLLEADPAAVFALLVALAQPFAAWLVHDAFKRYERSEGWAAFAGLLGIALAEALMRNPVGAAVGIALAGRVRARPRGGMRGWLGHRRPRSVMADLTGVALLLAFGVACAVASWQLGV